MTTNTNTTTPLTRRTLVIVTPYEIHVDRQGRKDRCYRPRRMTDSSARRLRRLLAWDGWKQDIQLDNEFGMMGYFTYLPKAAR
jgi:hypothetical protein